MQRDYLCIYVCPYLQQTTYMKKTFIAKVLDEFVFCSAESKEKIKDPLLNFMRTDNSYICSTYPYRFNVDKSIKAINGLSRDEIIADAEMMESIYRQIRLGTETLRSAFKYRFIAPDSTVDAFAGLEQIKDLVAKGHLNPSTAHRKELGLPPYGT